jgi:hypothetical protein
MAKVKRSLFKYRWQNITTLPPSRICPIMCKELLPGDYLNLKVSSFIRLMPQLSPAYTNIFAVVHFWVVPYRLIWSNWERFITGGRNNDQDTADPAPVAPYIYLSSQTPSDSSGRCPAIGSVFDYLGYPARQSNTATSPIIFTYGTQKFSALPLRAYTRIVNDWYIDHDLVDQHSLSMDDGLDTKTGYQITRQSPTKMVYITYPFLSIWSRDYFTSARPLLQRGAVTTVPVTIPGVPDPTDMVAKIAKKPIVETSATTTANFNGTKTNIDARKNVNYTPQGTVKSEFIGDKFEGTATITANVTSTFNGISSAVTVKSAQSELTIPSGQVATLYLTSSPFCPMSWQDQNEPPFSRSVLMYANDRRWYAVCVADGDEARLSHGFYLLNYGVQGMYQDQTAAHFYSYDYATYDYVEHSSAQVYTTNLSQPEGVRYQLGQNDRLQGAEAHNIALANFVYPAQSTIARSDLRNLPSVQPGIEFGAGDEINVRLINNLYVPPLTSSGNYIPIGTVKSDMSDAKLTFSGYPDGTVNSDYYGTAATIETGNNPDYTPQGTISANTNISGSNDTQDAPVVPKNITDINNEPTADTTGYFTVNDLRLATQIQLWAERTMRSGYRYVEAILAHFGVRTKDYRLNLAEFVGGFKVPIQISEVVQTSDQATSTSTPLATLGGHALGANQQRLRYYSTEHAFFIGVCSVRTRQMYQDGVNRMFSRFSKYDYYWNEFSHLPEQAILNQEIYNAGTQEVKAPTNYNLGVFGYQERYSEYKHFYSEVHGLFKTQYAYWHTARIFADSITTDNTPALNSHFITLAPTSFDRIFAVAYSDPGSSILAYFNFSLNMLRPLPKYSRPGLLDHSFGGY